MFATISASQQRRLTMFYATDTPHGLRHDPFKALVVPRPIGWVSTLSKDGIPNLAPFSFFNAISDRPHMVMFSVGWRNNTLLNIEATGECTCSFVNKAMTDAMNMSSAGVEHGVDEFALAGLDTTASTLVTPPRATASPAALECKLWQTIELPPGPGKDAGYTMVLATVVGIYINDDYLSDGMVDTAAMQPLARLGYMDYAEVNAGNIFSLNRPKVGEDGKTATLESGPWNGKYE